MSAPEDVVSLEAELAVKKLEVAYADAVDAYRSSKTSARRAAYKKARDKLAQARTEFKAAEEKAGRRTAGPGTPVAATVSAGVKVSGGGR
jgi:hypothetical protein